MTSPAPSGPIRRSWRHRIAKTLLVLALTYGFTVLMCLFLERRLVFAPTTAEEFWAEAPDTRIQNSAVVAPDGTHLHAWWLPPTDPDAGVILYCHGNGGNVSQTGTFLPNAQAALDGVGLLAFDYPGYGHSKGSPSEASCLMAAEAYWSVILKDFKIPEDRIILLGESLGGGVATEMAVRHRPRALVLAKTFTSLPAVAKHLYPFLPTFTLMRTRFDNESKLGNVSAPVFITHGKRDTLVPPAHAESLFAAAKEPKALCWMPDATHNDPLTPKFYAELRTFLAQRAPLASASGSGR